MAPHSHRYIAAPGLSITLFGRHARTLRLGRNATFALVGLVPLVGGIYLLATLYLMFHDQLLASLMARQMDMQYGYEDRISSLRSQLDRATSRDLVDRRSIDLTLHDLQSRGETLAARAAALDALVKASLPASARAAAQRSSGSDIDRIDPGAGADALRLDRPGADVAPAAAKTPGRGDVSSLFDDVDKRQSATLAALREPLLQSVARMASALTQTGLPTQRWQGANDVGGPFEPLPAGGLGFDANLALLRDAVRQRQMLQHVVDRVPLRRPVDGPLEITSGFGPRLDPFFGRAAMHTGLDLHESIGDAVESTAAGIVTIAGSEGGYGNMVEIDHGGGLTTRYAHLSAIEVAPHQMVPAGFVIGRVGSTGRSTGPHLHYETRIGGEPVDPSRFLRAGAALFPG